MLRLADHLSAREVILSVALKKGCAHEKRARHRTGKDETGEWHDDHKGHWAGLRSISAIALQFLGLC